MTTLLFIFVAGFLIATVVAPWWDERCRRRRVLDRVGRINVSPRVPPPPIRFDRDPSPRRRLSDYEWRAISEGMDQT